MSTSKPAAFYAIGAALAAAWLFMAWNGHEPITFLLSGEVFSGNFQYVAYEGSYAAGDGFRVAVNRMFLFFLFLTIVLLPLLTLWRITASPFTGFRRGLYLVLSAALSVFPAAAALVATLMVTRLTIDMGMTPKRLCGIASGVAGVMVYPLFLHVSGKRMKLNPANPASWAMVATFAMAMAWVEAAVVFYLRSMMERLEPYQPNPLPVIGGLASVELPREFATMLMLFAVGWLAGRTWRARLGYAAIAFGVWDIFYYVFLKVMCGWPHSLLDWDVLFLLPLPWWGPVLAPILISLLLVLWGTLASQAEPAPPAPPRRLAWILNALGVALALYVFMADALAAAPRGLEAIRTVLPERFNWPLFCVALALMSAPVIASSRRARPAPGKEWSKPERPADSGAPALDIPPTTLYNKVAGITWYNEE